MKKLIGFFIIGAALVVQAVCLHAASSTFMMSALVAAATGTSITANKVTGSTWSSVAGHDLDFGTLTLTTFANGDQAYLASSYFAIDVAGTGGAGTPNTTVTYTDGASPSGSIKLGDRTNISFRALRYNAGAYPTEYAISAHPKVLLNGLNKNITSTEVRGAGTGATWLRIYIGLNNGDGGFTPFSPGDPAGTYTGELRISATL